MREAVFYPMTVMAMSDFLELDDELRERCKDRAGICAFGRLREGIELL